MDGFINKQKNQKDFIKEQAGNDYLEVKENDQFKLSDDQKINIDKEFINEELANQRNFYKEYENKYFTRFKGTIIYDSNYKDNDDLIIQDNNLTYLNRKERRQKAKNSYNNWQKKLRDLNKSNLPVKNKLKELKDNQVITEEEYNNQLENLEPAYGITLDKKNTGTYALDLMKGTARYIAIENKKDDIIENLLKDAKTDNIELFNSYKDQIKALGPDLEIENVENAKIEDNIVISQKSITEYTNYIKKAIDNPVDTIKTAINDAIFSYGKISPKLLEKHAIPQKFEVLKQIRDKYRAAHAILQSPEIDQRLVKIANEIKSNELSKDNVILATEVYRRLDTDLCYTLEHYGIKYTDRKFLDKGSVETIAYESDGELTLRLLNSQRKKRVTKKENMVDNYWEERIRNSIIKNEEKKDNNPDQEQENKEKPKDDFKDEFGIYRTVDKISESMPQVDAQKKELFDKAAEGTKKLAFAISDLDKEIKAAKDAAKDANNTLDKGVKIRLNWFIRKKEQQQLDLMHRVAAYMNAMRFLAGRDMINPNGTRVLDELSAQKLKLNELNKNKKDDFIDVSNNFSFSNEISYKNVLTLTDNTSTFNDFKARIFEKFKNHQNINILKNILNSNNASKKYDILILKNENLDILSVEEIGRLFVEQEPSDLELSNLITDSVEGLMNDINVLYQKMSGKKIFLLSDIEKTNLVNDYLKIQKTNYAINRLLATKTSNPKNDFISNLFGKTETFKTILGDEFVNNKEWKYAELKFKSLRDEMELYRLTFLTDYIHNKKYSDKMFRSGEKDEILKLVSKNKNKTDMLVMLNYFSNKIKQTENLCNRHDFEIKEYKRINPEIKDEIVNEEIHEENLQNKNENIKNENEVKKNENINNENINNENLIKNNNIIKNDNVIKNDDEVIKNERIKQEEIERKKQEEIERKKQAEIERKKKEEERKKKWNAFIKADKLNKKYAVSVDTKKVPYTAKGYNDPGTDTWAHALASLINYNAGKAVVTGKDILLSDKKKDAPELFGKTRNKDSDPFEMGDFVFNYLPNTAIATTTFSDYEFSEKHEFLNFVKLTIEKNNAPVVIKRKSGFMTVYGITDDNLLICKRCTNDFVDDIYYENPDDIFEYSEKYGSISMYWLQKVNNNEKDFEKEYPELKLDQNKTTITNENQSNLKYQDDGIKIDKEIEQDVNGKKVKHAINMYLPKTLYDEKTANEKITSLKKLEDIQTEPPILKYDEHVKVPEKDNVPPYEYQHAKKTTDYCWACALSGLINYHANKKISSIETISNYNIIIPNQEDTKIESVHAYNNAVTDILKIKNGTEVGHPSIYGDYLFKKLPNTAIRTAQISKYDGKLDLCKRRFKEILSAQLKNGPVAIYRPKHFILCYELDGDNIKVKDSNRQNSNDILYDSKNINTIFDNIEKNGHIELVWLENIKGKEKELEAEFEDFTYDEKEMKFSKNDKNADYRPSGVDTLLHKDGIESGTKQPNDVVLQTIYLPKQMVNV